MIGFVPFNEYHFATMPSEIVICPEWKFRGSGTTMRCSKSHPYQAASVAGSQPSFLVVICTIELPSFILRRLVRHFAHPAERQDIAVALGVVILLEVQMHGCDAIVLPVGIRSVNLSNRHRNRTPLRIVPRPNSTTSLSPRAASSSTSRAPLPRLADLDPVIDNRIARPHTSARPHATSVCPAVRIPHGQPS